MKKFLFYSLCFALIPAMGYSDANSDLLDYAERGYIPGLRRALKDGARVNETVNHEGCSALMLAGSMGHLAAVKFLVENGADVNMAGGNVGRTALIETSSSRLGTPQVLSYLLSKGANVNAEWNNKQTALIRASIQGKHENIKVLLDKGAEPNHRDSCHAAIHYACQEGFASAVKALLSGKANPDLKDCTDETPLMYAANSGNLDITRALVEANASVNARSQANRTAVRLAAEKGHTDIVRLLLSKGADPNVADNEGRTAIWVAARYGHTEIIRMLISKGANVNVESNSGSTPLGVADEAPNRDEVKQILSEAGGR